MITQDTLLLTDKSADQPPLYLAPFTEQDLATVLPVHPDDLPYEREVTRAKLQRGSAAELVEGARQRPQTTEWGIFAREVTPNAFLGTVSLQDSLVTEEPPQFTSLVRETGTLIMQPEARGKGIGSKAKAAAIQHALDNGTVVFSAQTSEHNEAAQRSLRKIGFSHVDTSQEGHFIGGELTQHWMLAAPVAHKSVAANEQELTALQAGWQRYQDYINNFELSKLNNKQP